MTSAAASPAFARIVSDSDDMDVTSVVSSIGSQKRSPGPSFASPLRSPMVDSARSGSPLPTLPSSATEYCSSSYPPSTGHAFLSSALLESLKKQQGNRPTGVALDGSGIALLDPNFLRSLENERMRAAAADLSNGFHGGASSQRSVQSQQSWGQMAEIDLPPKVDDMTAPTYVLEESRSNQSLWKQTAGNRPPQPLEERAFFERMWTENFARSEVHYGIPVDHLVNATASTRGVPKLSPSRVESVPTAVVEDDSGDSVYSSIFTMSAPSHSSHRAEDVAEAILVSRMNDFDMMSQPDLLPVSSPQTLDEDTSVVCKGRNAFGTTVSKSFAQTDADGIMSVLTVNICIASYRVVECKHHGRYAQFHVIYREGNMRDTIGLWKRYRDFEMLANKLSVEWEGCSTAHHGDGPNEEVEHLPNAVTSWRLMKKRKRWYRCLDAGYLSLKVFLLERFLHDVLFESSSPEMLRDFVRDTEDAS